MDNLRGQQQVGNATRGDALSVLLFRLPLYVTIPTSSRLGRQEGVVRGDTRQEQVQTMLSVSSAAGELENSIRGGRMEDRAQQQREAIRLQMERVKRATQARQRAQLVQGHQFGKHVIVAGRVLRA